MPKTDIEIADTTKEFYNIAKFPKVIEVIDYTHVKVQSLDKYY